MLKNLSREMSGTYVCTAKNNAGISKCNITLEVNSCEYTPSVVESPLLGWSAQTLSKGRFKAMEEGVQKTVKELA